jgi:hypothetical protein
MNEIAKLTMTSALIAGLGRALLCTRHPSWRLPALADPVALAMKPFPTVLAGLLLLAGTLEQFNRMADTSLQVTLLGAAGVAGGGADDWRGAAARQSRAQRTGGRRRTSRSPRHAGGADPRGRHADRGGVVRRAADRLHQLRALPDLRTGLVRYRAVQPVPAHATDARHLRGAVLRAARSGRVIKQLFGVGDSHLEQVSTVLSGLGASVLLLLAVLALLTGGFGTTPADLLNSLLTVLGGEKLRALNIMPDRI